MPQGSGAAKRLWGFGHVGSAGEVRARPVESGFFGVRTVLRSVEVGARAAVPGDCECRWLRIEHMNARLAVAGEDPATTDVAALVDRQ